MAYMLFTDAELKAFRCDADYEKREFITFSYFLIIWRLKVTCQQSPSKKVFSPPSNKQYINRTFALSLSLSDKEQSCVR